jgi:hypothetical protein
MTEPKWAIPEAMATRKLLDLSSSHVSKAGLAWLNEEGTKALGDYYKSSVVVFANEISLIVVIGTEPISSEDAILMRMPSCVWTALNYCFHSDFQYVRFDPDAPIIFGIPVYGQTIGTYTALQG